MMIIRDAWLIALANSLTSIFAGFVVFGTLGMLAQVDFIILLSLASMPRYILSWHACPGGFYYFVILDILAQVDFIILLSLTSMPK